MDPAQLASSCDGPSAQDDKIVDVSGPIRGGVPTSAMRERPGVGRIGRGLDQPVEGQQPPSVGLGRFLPIDLLKAEDVGLQPQQLRSQHLDPHLERRIDGGAVVEALQVERSEAKSHGVTGFPGTTLHSSFGQTLELDPGRLS